MAQLWGLQFQRPVPLLFLVFTFTNASVVPLCKPFVGSLQGSCLGSPRRGCCSSHRIILGFSARSVPGSWLESHISHRHCSLGTTFTLGSLCSFPANQLSPYLQVPLLPPLLFPSWIITGKAWKSRPVSGWDGPEGPSSPRALSSPLGAQPGSPRTPESIGICGVGVTQKLLRASGIVGLVSPSNP